jgi:hypothetical protein
MPPPGAVMIDRISTAYMAAGSRTAAAAVPTAGVAARGPAGGHYWKRRLKQDRITI